MSLVLSVFRWGHLYLLFFFCVCVLLLLLLFVFVCFYLTDTEFQQKGNLIIIYFKKGRKNEKKKKDSNNMEDRSPLDNFNSIAR